MDLRYTARDIAAAIDHAVLKPEFTREDVDRELDRAATCGVFSVCVRPSDVAYAARRLDGTGVAVGTVIGFPHGTTSQAAKVAEVEQALVDGATEFDMVIHIGALIGGDDAFVVEDIAAVVEAAGPCVSKVILETSLLTDSQIAHGSALTERGGATFVKTSTGFAGDGATVEHVELMRNSVTNAVQVKASGGVRSFATAASMLDAGATRLGTSSSALILEQARAAESGVTPAAGDAAHAGEDSATY